VSIFLALLHHPVLNRNGEVLTTAVTNVDMHDISRLSRTYGLQRFFVITPIELQQELCHRVIRHWAVGAGGQRNRHRSEAFQVTEVQSDLNAAIERVEELTGKRPTLVATGAKLVESVTPYDKAGQRFLESDVPTLILLGTGWGIASEVIDRADVLLPAIVGPEGIDGYNHLSVRSAASIILDRLFGRNE